MRTETTKIYQFNELSPEAQEKAISDNRNWNVSDIEWWDSVAEDIEMLGGKLVAFDTSRGTIELKLDTSPTEFAENIKETYGQSSYPFKTAQYYLNGVIDNDEFRHNIGQDFLSILRKNYDYLTSDEAVKQSLVSNEMEFTADGKNY